ncbi:PRC-barrel domain-containing protein [Thalassobaculum sp. OXR-137]|uniref:PRC-barrel domain-containing protein n=1 Tax=Thalassobaculum sp. OXR-137 TaxID=3100173 RepID=UPI002AC8A48E|nr:PRC-barrel domain-containing protein [Thalassobaculum sp. OXR-137]WPZ33701.1 PRC-barrel domain-containing protein [Thalassobaculum sp. OXR-137]
MIKKMLATTALVALMSGPAIAASDAQTNMRFESVDTIGAKQIRGYLASNLMGHSVYASTAEDADRIGEIDDAIVGEDGSIKAVIIGVGGFLGMGEKNVAVDFSRLSFEKAGDDEYRLVSALTKEELEKAGAYEAPERTTSLDDKTPTTKESTANNVPATSTVAAVDKDATTTATEPKNNRESFMEGRKKLSSEKIEAATLDGAWAYDTKFNHIGEVGEVLVTADGKIDAMVVDVGGFLGLGEKPVAMAFKEVEMYRNESDEIAVIVPYTEEQLDTATAYDADGYAKKTEGMLLTPMN